MRKQALHTWTDFTHVQYAESRRHRQAAIGDPGSAPAPVPCHAHACVERVPTAALITNGTPSVSALSLPSSPTRRHRPPAASIPMIRSDPILGVPMRKRRWGEGNQTRPSTAYTVSVPQCLRGQHAENDFATRKTRNGTARPSTVDLPGSAPRARAEVGTCSYDEK